MFPYYKLLQRTTNGKNYYTFEYTLTSRNFSRAAFATIAVANGMTYVLFQVTALTDLVLPYTPTLVKHPQYTSFI